jgi:hypothetical protein
MLVNTSANGIYGENANIAFFGQTNDPQAVRLLEPCGAANAAGCDRYEDQGRIRLASPRWYSTSVRIEDGSMMIIGGIQARRMDKQRDDQQPHNRVLSPKEHPRRERHSCGHAWQREVTDLRLI